MVCPAVEEAESVEDTALIPISADFGGEQTAKAMVKREPDLPMKAAVQYAAELQERLPDLTIAFVHG